MGGWNSHYFAGGPGQPNYNSVVTGFAGMNSNGASLSVDMSGSPLTTFLTVGNFGANYPNEYGASSNPALGELQIDNPGFWRIRFSATLIDASPAAVWKEYELAFHLNGIGLAKTDLCYMNPFLPSFGTRVNLEWWDAAGTFGIFNAGDALDVRIRTNGVPISTFIAPPTVGGIMTFRDPYFEAIRIERPGG